MSTRDAFGFVVGRFGCALCLGWEVTKNGVRCRHMEWWSVSSRRICFILLVKEVFFLSEIVGCRYCIGFSSFWRRKGYLYVNLIMLSLIMGQACRYTNIGATKVIEANYSLQTLRLF